MGVGESISGMAEDRDVQFCPPMRVLGHNEKYAKVGNRGWGQAHVTYF